MQVDEDHRWNWSWVAGISVVLICLIFFGKFLDDYYPPNVNIYERGRKGLWGDKEKPVNADPYVPPPPPENVNVVEDVESPGNRSSAASSSITLPGSSSVQSFDGEHHRPSSVASSVWGFLHRAMDAFSTPSGYSRLSTVDSPEIDPESGHEEDNRSSSVASSVLGGLNRALGVFSTPSGYSPLSSLDSFDREPAIGFEGILDRVNVDHNRGATSEIEMMLRNQPSGASSSSSPPPPPPVH
ncbi:unnamed protein product [Linum trigynum]|uniref:Uncharacterized protein n=1 Tax=Linum trigynum TaxID=586398 RepID=A0AAV2DCW5_9ROSI